MAKLLVGLCGSIFYQPPQVLPCQGLLLLNTISCVTVHPMKCKSKCHPQIPAQGSSGVDKRCIKGAGAENEEEQTS